MDIICDLLLAICDFAGSLVSDFEWEGEGDHEGEGDCEEQNRMNTDPPIG